MIRMNGTVSAKLEMKEEEFASVVETMRLLDGAVFPLPVVLDLTDEQARQARAATKLNLTFEGQDVAEVVPESIFTCNKKTVAEQVFGPLHPSKSMRSCSVESNYYWRAGIT